MTAGVFLPIYVFISTLVRDMIHPLQNISLIQEMTEVLFDEGIRNRYLKMRDGKAIFQAVKERSEQVRVYRIVYRSSGHDVVGFFIEPRKKSAKLPCIIFNRGGSGNFGKITKEEIFAWITRMATWGYIVIASQYSGNDGGEGKDEHGGADLEDVLTLYKILKKYSRADISRIGMHGGSRGGMMTYLCLARVKWLKAAVVVAGAADLFRSEKLRPEMVEMNKKMFGGRRADLKKRSAVFWVHKFHKKTPVLLLHGTADWRVSPEDSLDVSREMLREKIPHRLVLLEGADHVISEFWPLRHQMTRAWFDRFVRDREKLPNLKLHGD